MEKLEELDLTHSDCCSYRISYWWTFTQNEDWILSSISYIGLNRKGSPRGKYGEE